MEPGRMEKWLFLAPAAARNVGAVSAASDNVQIRDGNMVETQ